MEEIEKRDISRGGEYCNIGLGLLAIANAKIKKQEIEQKKLDFEIHIWNETHPQMAYKEKTKNIFD